jgi:hypothetical protein
MNNSTETLLNKVLKHFENKVPTDAELGAYIENYAQVFPTLRDADLPKVFRSFQAQRTTVLEGW